MVFKQGRVNLARYLKRQAGKADKRVAWTAAEDYRNFVGGSVCLVMA